jgi:hypothetical protein
MSNFDPTLDELVSAYLDGEATPDERARVEADPELLARVAVFRQLGEAIAGKPPAIDEPRRQQMIGRALAETPAPLAPVRSLTARRLERVGPIAAAAALIAALIGFGTWVVGSQDNDAGDASSSGVASPLRTAADAFGPEAATAGAGGNTALDSGKSATTVASGGSGAAAPTAGRVSADLGAFTDEAALRQALVTARNLSSAATPTTTIASGSQSAEADAAVTACGLADAVRAPDTTSYTAELRGRRVTVIVTGARAEVVDNATCTRTPLDLTAR